MTRPQSTNPTNPEYNRVQLEIVITSWAGPSFKPCHIWSTDMWVMLGLVGLGLQSVAQTSVTHMVC